MAPLDYNRIKEFLRVSAHSKEIEVCTTLQAMSWRITKVPQSIRKQNVHSYQHFDILEMKLVNNPSSIFNMLIDDKAGDRVKSFFIILINALASEYVGRCYLL